MKTASIIAVGTEIMNGKMDDTNSTYFSRVLADRGVKVLYRVNVDDTVESIVKAAEFVSESDLIIFTGGLGPTEDDLTREGVARYLNKPLVFVPEVWESITERFRRMSLTLYESNKQQAYIIEGSKVLTNEHGSAPGLFYSDSGKIIALIPGPPAENKIMTQEKLLPMLTEEGFFETELVKKVIRIYRAGEGQIADLFKDVQSEGLEVGYYFSHHGWVEVHFKKWIHLSGSGTGEEEKGYLELVKQVQPFIDILEKQKLLYTEDEHITRLVLDLLQSKNKTIAFAESITGGALAAGIVENDGASKVLDGSIVSYSNHVKEQLLNVSGKSLTDYGAVSHQVAEQMVRGLSARVDADIYVSITGIAGPTGDTPDKPLGLVYMGFLFDGKLDVVKVVLTGSRERVIIKCINYVYTEVYSYLKSL